MLCLKVHVPFACFRPGHARGHMDTDLFPSPLTCYGCLLSLVGETKKLKHVGVRITPGLYRGSLSSDLRKRKSTVIRKANYWQCGGFTERVDRQQVLMDVHVLMWIDSSQETEKPNLEERVRNALAHPELVERHGGLSLGESKFLVNSIDVLGPDETVEVEMFRVDSRGRKNAVVWTNHINFDKNVWCRGDLVRSRLEAPDPDRMPQIRAPM